MTKEEVTNNLFNEINSIEPVNFRGAYLSYNQAITAWVIKLRVKFIGETTISDVLLRFREKGIEFKSLSKKTPDVYVTYTTIKDSNPTSPAGKV